MDNNKKFDGEEGQDISPKDPPAPRARNRTVMLTPEITGQVRARLAQDMGAVSQPKSAPEIPPVQPQQPQGFFTPPAVGKARATVTEPAPRPPAPAPAAVFSEGVVWIKKTPVVGFLVSYDINVNGDVYDLRSGRLMISSEASGTAQNILMLKDESVSMNHAILRISAHGEVQVLDQLSEFGTKIKRYGTDEEIELSGDKGNVEHGDVLSFGNRKFHVCIIAQSSSAVDE